MRSIILMGCLGTALAGCNLPGLSSLSGGSATIAEQQTLISQCAREIGIPSDGALVQEDADRLLVVEGSGIDAKMAAQLNACTAAKIAASGGASIDPTAKFVSETIPGSRVYTEANVSAPGCPVRASVLFSGSSYCPADL